METIGVAGWVGVLLMLTLFLIIVALQLMQPMKSDRHVILMTF